jgi:hypothetical protein
MGSGSLLGHPRTGGRETAGPMRSGSINPLGNPQILYAGDQSVERVRGDGAAAVMGFREKISEWIEVGERWLHRSHLVYWIVGLLVSTATAVAGNLQAFPPYWVIPAALATASLAFFLVNQVAVFRKRRHDQNESTDEIESTVAPPSRPFPTRTIVTLIVLVLIVVGSLASPVIHRFASSSSMTPHTSLSDPHPPTLGISAGLLIIDDLRGKTNGLAMPEGWSVIITGPPETGYVQTALKLMLQHGIEKIKFEELPNSALHLDAPRFPEPQFSGIILHGEDALTESITALGGCFKIQTTHVMLPGLVEYYHAKNLVWIEIGKGSPWHTPQVCTG